MKTLLTIFIAAACFLQAGAQQLIINYDDLLASNPFTIGTSDTEMVIKNVISGKGAIMAFGFNGDKKKGSIKQEQSSETVSFHLTKIFKNKPKTAGEFFVTETQSVSYSFHNAGVTANSSNNSGGPVVLQYTGIAYWDALSVYQYITSLAYQPDSLLDLINQYTVNKYSNLDAGKNNNHFLKMALDEYNPAKQRKASKDKTNASLDDLMINQGANILGSLSGLDVTQYVQAFADFLKDRIKEELTLAYIDEFRRKIKGVPEFTYLLPKTISVFSTGDVFSLPSMGATYKTAFAADMADLPENFERMVFSLEKYQQYRGREDFILFMITYYSIKMSAEKHHPADILRFVDAKYGFNANSDTTSKVRIALSLLNAFSKNLRNTDDNRWIEKAKVSVLNPFVVNVFFGLMYEQNRQLFDVEFKAGDKTTTIAKLLQSQPVERVFQFVTLAGNIEERIKEYKDLPKDALTSKDKKELVVNYFINNADDFFNLFNFSGTIISNYINTPEFYKYKEIAKNSIEVAKGVKTNNVAQVGVNVIALIKQITDMGQKDSAILQQLTHYINFITDMVYADSAVKIRQVLQNYAAPPRSYRAVRQSSSSVSLASFPGIYVGYETDTQNGLKKNNGVFGITAPIGISVGWGNSKKETHSAALFLSLVDIGAALTYRWSNDSVDLPQKVTLGQIFSPGLFGVLGFKNSPLALKAGAQYMPQLRSIKQGANATEANAWHFNLSLCIDIPILILSRKK